MKPFLKSGATILLTPDPSWDWVGWDGRLTVYSLVKPLHLSGDNIIIKSDVPLFTLIMPRMYTAKAFSDVPGMIATAFFSVDDPTLSDKIKVINFAPLLISTTGTFTCNYTIPSEKITPAGPIPDLMPIKSGTWKVEEPNQHVFFRNTGDGTKDMSRQPCVEAEVPGMSHGAKMLAAVKQSHVLHAAFEEMGGVQGIVQGLAIAGAVAVGLALLPQAAIGVAVVGIGLSVAEAVGGVHLLSNFYKDTEKAQTCSDISNASNSFSDGVAKTGIGVLGAVMGAMGVKSMGAVAEGESAATGMAGAKSIGAAAEGEAAATNIAEAKNIGAIAEGEAAAVKRPRVKEYDFKTDKVATKFLTEDEAVAYKMLKEQKCIEDQKDRFGEIVKNKERSEDQIDQVLMSGSDFKPVPLEKGERLYKFGNKGDPDKQDSAYWMREDQFKSMKQEHFNDGQWDNIAIKQKLALPCYNNADEVYVAEVSTSHKVVQSTINPAKEVIYHQPNGVIVSQTKESMVGGGVQITPNPSNIKMIKK